MDAPDPVQSGLEESVFRVSVRPVRWPSPPKNGNMDSTDKRVLPKYKMPRNMTGGSGHRSQRNSESNKTKANNKLNDALLDDMMNELETEGVHVARVMRRLGSGMMECFFVTEEEVEHKKRMVDKLVHAPLRGGLRGRGKKDVWIDVGSVVLLANTGLGGTPWKIMSVFNDRQIARYQEVVPTADKRIFARAATDAPAEDGGIEFVAEDDEVDVDDI